LIKHVKTLTIILLAVSALFLTTRLWFDEISRSSFGSAMLMLLSLAQPETDPGQNFFVKPARIVTSFGENRYNIMYNNIDTSVHKRDCDEAITLALDLGEYRSSSAAEIDRLMSEPCYAYNYSVAMPSSTFVITYPQRRNMLTSRVRNFEWVVIRPYNNFVTVTFLDVDARAHEYHLNNAALGTRILQNIQDIQSSADGSQRLIYKYEGGFFIPQAEGFSYPKLLVDNQYLKGGSPLDFIRNEVNVFFSGGGSIWDSMTTQSLTYSDENTVVKYIPAEANNGIDMLEYANYQVIDRLTVTSFSTDYNSAIRFIHLDSMIENEYYLAEALDTENKRVFYFNYVINDLPVSLSSEDVGHTGLLYPIEIEVKNGVVTRYRKLVYQFINDEKQTVEISFENAMISSDEQPENLPLSNVELKYRINVKNAMLLYWFIELDDGSTFVHFTTLSTDY